MKIAFMGAFTDRKTALVCPDLLGVMFGGGLLRRCVLINRSGSNTWLSRLAIVLGVIVAPLGFTDNSLTVEEVNDGWELLFNGKDMDQWRNFKKPGLSPKWIVENGTMKLSGPGGGDVLTKKSYTNFDLRLEWKISIGGNSGIFILVDETGDKIYSHAPEIQILDNERHSDNKIDSHRSGSLYDMVASHPSSYKPAGEWNQVRIVFHDRFLRVWQNGVMTVTISLDSTTWESLLADSKFGHPFYSLFGDWEGFAEADYGHIGLQDHGDPVAFKNIKIRQL